MTDLQRQQAVHDERFMAYDWDSEALSESLQDLFFSVQREAGARDKQVTVIGRHLSDVYKKREDLQMQVNELTYRLDGLERLAGRVERLESDKRGSKIPNIQIVEVLQQVAALEEEVRGMQRICEEDSPVVTPHNNKVSGKIWDRLDALECKTSAMT